MSENMEKTNDTKISVVDFIAEYNSVVNEAGKDAVCKKYIKRTYVPVMEKYVSLLACFNTCSRQANGMVYYDSFNQYITYLMTVIRMYTSLDTSDVGLFDSYDLLKESEAIDNILILIGENELKEFERINEMIKSDVINNELNPYSYFAVQINRLGDILGGLGKVVSEAVTADESAASEMNNNK